MIIVEGIDHINIPVTDLERSKNFYSDIFDFEVTEETEDFVMMSLDPFKIRLVKFSEVKSQLTESNLPVMSFILDIDDFTEAISELETKTVKILKGPEGITGGESLTMSDPDENLIELFYTS